MGNLSLLILHHYNPWAYFFLVVSSVQLQIIMSLRIFFSLLVSVKALIFFFFHKFGQMFHKRIYRNVFTNSQLLCPAMGKSDERSVSEKRTRVRGSPGETPPYVLMAPNAGKIRSGCNVLQVNIQNYTSGSTKVGKPSRGLPGTGRQLRDDFSNGPGRAGT